ncbi:MAG: PilN domain-containing protein [Thermodesulfobacteriota bacterium]|nr:PilN domain-containing protein [Thermodesulfobacteriota bacterium]
MIKINLLPYRAARRKENIRQQISIFLLLIIFATAGLVYYHIRLSGKVSDANDRLVRTQNELRSYKEKVAEVDRIKQKLSILDQKLQVMEKLNKDRKEPVALLQTITGLTVKGRMWITSLEEDSDTIVSISGIAMDNKTVATFMTRIEESSFFTSVDLSDLVSEDKKGLKLKRFELKCSKPA